VLIAAFTLFADIPLRSAALVQIASSHEPHAAVIADTLNLPHPDSSFDFAISIAVIHHLSSPARRQDAIKTILHTLKPATTGSAAGNALIFAWALEQKNSRRGWDVGDNQDVLVPWVLKPDANEYHESKTYQRYYHLYKEGELEKDIKDAGGVVVRAGYDRDNWWAIAQRPAG
jgi:tRNA (uracil-5-)-methyltransferase TRM9